MKTIAIIVAGGEGKRVGGSLPKQFLDLAGKPMIVYSLEVFQESPLIDEIVVVAHKDHVERTEKLVREHNITKTLDIVKGGASRQESSYNGLKACPDDTDIALIHDAARPFVTGEMLKRLIEAAGKTGAAAPVIPVEDTIVVEKEGLIASVPDRSRFRRIQTPQVFRYALIMEAHRTAAAEGVSDATDDCGLVLEKGGVKISLVDGDKKNMKITCPEDARSAGYDQRQE